MWVSETVGNNALILATASSVSVVVNEVSFTLDDFTLSGLIFGLMSLKTSQII